MANGVSVDDLVESHPEIDEKALRRGYAQVKTQAKRKANPDAPRGRKKVAKKSTKKPSDEEPRVASVASTAPVNGPKASEVLRRLVLEHGTKAVQAAIAELQS